jgi:hypothetical protein
MSKPEPSTSALSPAEGGPGRRELAAANILEIISQLHLQEILHNLQKKFPLPQRSARHPRRVP